MTVPNIEQAREHLAQLETEQRQEHRAKLIAQLAEVRRQLREDKRELEKLKRKVLKAQADLDNSRTEIVRYSEALSILRAQKPNVAEHLPDDPESVEWHRKCMALEDALELLQAKRITLPNVELLRIEGVNLAKRVQELLYAENNTLHALDGSLGTIQPGGVFSV